MNSEINLPGNLYDYYRSNPSLFGEKIFVAKKIFYSIGLLACIILLIFPSIISVYPWVIRIFLISGAVYFSYRVFIGEKTFFNKVTGGVIKPLMVKKIDVDRIGEKDLIETFINKDFEKLAFFTEAKKKAVQLCIHEDRKGKVFYCQLVKYFSSSGFRALTDVVILKGAVYHKYEPVIRSIG